MVGVICKNKHNNWNMVFTNDKEWMYWRFTCKECGDEFTMKISLEEGKFGFIV